MKKNILEPNEKVLWEGKPHRASYLLKRCLLMLIPIAIILAFIFFSNRMFSLVSNPFSSLDKIDFGSNVSEAINKIGDYIGQNQGSKDIIDAKIKELESELASVDAEMQEKLAPIEEGYNNRLEEIEKEYEEEKKEILEEYNASSNKEIFKNHYDTRLKMAEDGYKSDLEIAQKMYDIAKKGVEDVYVFEKSGLEKQIALLSNPTDIENMDVTTQDVNEVLDIMKGIIPEKALGNIFGNTFGDIWKIPRLMLLLPVIIIGIVIIFGLIIPFLSVRNLYYMVTDKRVIIQHGIIGINYRTFEYTKIDDITVRVGLIDKMFNTGNVTVLTEYNYVKDSDGDGHTSRATNESNSFLSIKDPYEVFNKIRTISQDMRTDVYYPNKLRPNENPGYNTKYDKKDGE